MSSRFGNGSNGRHNGAELVGGVGLPGSGTRNDLFEKPGSALKPHEEAAAPSLPEPFVDLPAVLDQLQLILGEMEEQHIASYRECNHFQSQRASFTSISQAAAYADELRLSLESRGKEYSGLTDFIEKYKSLRGLRLSYADFLANLDSSAIVPRVTTIAIEFNSNAPGEYKSGASFVFCGMQKGSRGEPLLLHMHGGRGEERVYLAREPLQRGDIAAVKVLGPVTRQGLLTQIENQLLGS